MAKSIRSAIDLSRLSAAASRPGIDPRMWIALAVVKELGYDPGHGLFADVQFPNDGTIETVLVGTEYAGNDFGQYWPIQLEDIVLVAMPSGDPGQGGVIIKRLWSGSEKPPAELSEGGAGVNGSDPTTDPTTRIEDGATLRIVGKNGANVKIELDGNATYEIKGTGGTTIVIDGDAGVRLGNPTPPNVYRGVARASDSVTATGSPPAPGDPPPDPAAALPMQAWAAAVVTACAAIPAAVPPLGEVIGFISSSSDKTKTE